MSQVTQHGNTNWLHGAMLVTTYVRRLMGGFVGWKISSIATLQRKTFFLRALGMKLYLCFLSKTAECYGVSCAIYRLRCVLGELGRFREETGFREPVPGTGSEPVLGDRFCGSGEPVPGTGPRFRWFRQVLRFQETGFQTPRFRVQKEPGSGNPRY